jgi:hypothetical protein
MLRYAPPIYMVIIKGIIFVFIIILITVYFLLLFFFIPLLVMYPTVVSASLRLLSNTYPPYPPFLFVSPPGGGPSVIHTQVPEGNVYSLSVYSGYFVEKGEEETRDRSPLRNRCFHTQGAPLPWVLICNLPPKMDNISVIPRDLNRSNPGKNGTFFLGYRL